MNKISLLILLAFAGCASKSPKDDYWRKQQHLLSGPCFVWGGVEKKRAKAKEFCWINWPSDHTLMCNREDGHKGKHHHHSNGHCLAVWR